MSASNQGQHESPRSSTAPSPGQSNLRLALKTFSVGIASPPMTSEHSLDKQSRPELLAPLRSVLSTSPAAEIHLHCQSQPFLLETIEHGLCHEHAERPLKYSRGIVQLEQALPIALQSPSHILRNLWILRRVWVDGAVAPHLVDGVALSLKGWVCWIKKKLGIGSIVENLPKQMQKPRIVLVIPQTKIYWSCPKAMNLI